MPYHGYKYAGGKRHVLEPDKTIIWNGLRIPLFRRMRVARVVGVSEASWHVFEKAKMIPMPMFTEGKRMYYSIWEYVAAASTRQRFGSIRAGTRLSGPFTEALTVLWKGIREELIAGKEPRSITCLMFADEGELRTTVKRVLADAGISSEPFLDRAVDTFRAHRLLL